jgi:hypothetical protein
VLLRSRRGRFEGAARSQAAVLELQSCFSRSTPQSRITDLEACGRQQLVGLSLGVVELCSTCRCVLLLAPGPQPLDFLPDVRLAFLQRLNTPAA